MDFWLQQSASKHGGQTFLYSATGELVCNGKLWSDVVMRQLRSYNVGHQELFGINLVKIMKITTVIQYKRL